MFTKKIIISAFVLLSLFLTACGGSTREVARIDTQEMIDLSGKWNDTDARLVAEEMVDDALKRPWLTDFLQKESRKPVVVVGKIRNKSSEHIAVDVFANDIERELLNTGKVKFVAEKDQRDEIREERKDQNEFASKESFKKFYKELGADYYMSGTVNSVTDMAEGQRVIFYQVDMELINIETNEKVWLGNKKIKKFISQDSYSM
ncbi:MAG: penicillin-binding protein activator LpoB [Melioribacteraceae bacterium]|nr:MAG: penicillin-binding protein activator LpoB [Melioribacteraceae bacterium]